MPNGPARAVMVAATRQHVGKTTTSLGVLSGVLKRFPKVGFFKPVGQQHVDAGNGIRVDKDVKLAKDYFNLDHCDFADMSPVVIPRGYTKKFLDKEIDEKEQLATMMSAFERIKQNSDFVVVEGTGHTGVGSIVNLNNACVAAHLGLDMILVANGGIGAAFDELELNKVMCDHYGVKVRGVIINKVIPDKCDMVREYVSKALDRPSWTGTGADYRKVPLLAVVPDKPALSNPSMLDFELLFGTKLLSGEENRLRHFHKFSLVTSGLRRFLQQKLASGDHDRTCFVAHASRNDIILGFLAHTQMYEQKHGKQFGGGLILTGVPPHDTIQDVVRDHIQCSKMPILYAPITTYDAMDKIVHYTAKLSATDAKRTAHAVSVYEPLIDFDMLLEGLCE